MNRHLYNDILFDPFDKLLALLDRIIELRQIRNLTVKQEELLNNCIFVANEIMKGKSID